MCSAKSHAQLQFMHFFSRHYFNDFSSRPSRFPGSQIPPDNREASAGSDEQLSGRSVETDPVLVPEERPRSHREDGDHRNGHQTHEASPPPFQLQGPW